MYDSPGLAQKREQKETKQRTTPFGINLMKSQVLHWAAQGLAHDALPMLSLMSAPTLQCDPESSLYQGSTA